MSKNSPISKEEWNEYDKMLLETSWFKSAMMYKQKRRLTMYDRLKCKLGFHDWRHYNISSYEMIKMCSRCGLHKKSRKSPKNKIIKNKDYTTYQTTSGIILNSNGEFYEVLIGDHRNPDVAEFETVVLDPEEVQHLLWALEQANKDHRI